MNPLIIIPARLSSTRLPGKPLADIAGLPMIVHVMRRAEEAKIAPTVVACAEKEIAHVVEAAGGTAVLTDPNHESGTDRIFEALQKIDPHKKHDIIINVQGDLPTLDPVLIKAALIPFVDNDTDISTLVTGQSGLDKNNPNIVKAILSKIYIVENYDCAKALYFTRAPAPYGNDTFFHHIGLYAYSRAALERFTSLAPSPLEQLEKLEQLRALENGMVIKAVKVGGVPLGVDTAEDLNKARKLLEK